MEAVSTVFTLRKKISREIAMCVTNIKKISELATSALNFKIATCHGAYIIALAWVFFDLWYVPHVCFVPLFSDSEIVIYTFVGMAAVVNIACAAFQLILISGINSDSAAKILWWLRSMIFVFIPYRGLVLLISLYKHHFLYTALNVVVLIFFAVSTKAMDVYQTEHG
ncbi:uncharacterized protein LOC132202438 isoform X2 [Neocloeon triangulifer]|uniref:uncharacterized protein LOC132202438 isoform X2 n=1 Tax=Neocloeon triangulifer TaxID=2078957 RepID=UPI00286EC9CE|nr:uncharacterized protein LOC132202438 isoform X2 [Neocloeon triangulifer]